MHYRWIWGAFALLMAQWAAAQEAPVELDAQRKPDLLTKGNCLIKGATLLTVTQGVLPQSDLLVQNGKIAAIGKNLTPPPGVAVVNGAGKFLTPGLIDAHSHIASDSVNEGGSSITAEVRLHDVLNPNSLSLYRGLSSGVTASLVLHGSANAIGGQSVVIKMKWKRPVSEMPVPDAPRMIKFALGENVTRSGRPESRNTRFPGSRMGVERVYRRAFEEAKQYNAAWERYERDRAQNPDLVPPRKDLRLEALADILQGNIRVQCHSYRADEMLMMLRLSQEFKFKLVFQHALEAYRITPEIAAAGAGVSTFAADWAYKIEAHEAIPYNAALCVKAGIVTSVNSDNGSGTYRLNLEAAKAFRYGGLTENEALRLVTINPAIQLGIERRAGSLEVGKDADLALWEGHPLTNYSRCVLTMVEGEVFFQRRDAFQVDSASRIKNTLTLSKSDPSALPPLKPSRLYAIVGGMVHPISGAPIPNGTVVLEDGKIRAVGANVTIPAGAVVVRAQGMHVYPGLIDAGSQLGLTEIGSIDETNDAGETGEFQPDALAFMGVHPASELIPTTRIAGITTTQTSPGGRAMLAGQSAILHLAGWTAEQMQLKRQSALNITFPEGVSEETLEILREFLSPEEVEERLTQATTGLKKLKDYFAQAKRYADLRAKDSERVAIEPRFEAMRPYLAGQLPVILRVDSPKGIREAIAFAEEYKLKAVIGGGGEAWRVADLLAKKNVPLLYSVPLSNSMGGGGLKEYDPYDTNFASVSRLLKAGVKVAFQSEDAATARNLPTQVGLLCAYGTPYDAALRALTLGAAEILGVADQVGSLEVGKQGDVIITDGDPLEITTTVQRMFIAGKPVELESKHSRLYQLYRKRLEEIEKPAVRAAK